MNIRSNAILLLAGSLLMVTQPGASCMSDTTTGPGPNNPPRSDPFPSGNPPPQEDPNYVPQRADIVREGRGALRYTTDADGTIYIQNLRREQTEHQSRVHRGQVIEVLPDENRIRVDDNTVSKTDLKRDDVHRIYLLRDRRFEDDRRDRTNRDDTAGNRPPRGVPVDAQLMGEGKNKEISFRPSKTGSVYVYDADEHKVVVKIPIRGGEQFVLSPGRSRASINGKPVEQNIFDSRTEYRVYFFREG